MCGCHGQPLAIGLTGTELYRLWSTQVPRTKRPPKSQGQDVHPSPKDKTSTQVPRTRRPPKSQGQDVHPSPKDKTSTQVPRTRRPPKSQGQDVHPSPKDKTSTQVPRTRRPPKSQGQNVHPLSTADLVHYSSPKILPALKLHEDQTAF
ncbi:hypothetical protein BgiMline_010216 [Biomphalaria glabrata]|nr:hypothetical protein BgiMline_023951 [Biomphalaria glabrata]